MEMFLVADGAFNFLQTVFFILKRTDTDRLSKARFS
jgi:hypothetical protein